MKFSFKRFALLLLAVAAVGLGIVYYMIQAQASRPAPPAVAGPSGAAMLKDLKDNLPYVTTVGIQKTIAFDRKNHPKDGYQNSNGTGWNMRQDLDEVDRKKVVDILMKVTELADIPTAEEFPSYTLLIAYTRRGPRGGGMLPPPSSSGVDLRQLSAPIRDEIMKVLGEKHADFLK